MVLANQPVANEELKDRIREEFTGPDSVLFRRLHSESKVTYEFFEGIW